MWSVGQGGKAKKTERLKSHFSLDKSKIMFLIHEPVLISGLRPELKANQY
jgi:hypothetical protein